MKSQPSFIDIGVNLTHDQLLNNLDKVIKIIRSSKNPEEAKSSLIKIKWKIKKSLKMITI